MNILPKELRIGPVVLDNPFVQAALSGYSDSPMRVLARRMGASYTLCEVMLDKFLVQLKPRRKNRHLLYIADEEHPVGGQLMGAVPEEFAPAALKLVEHGFDIIDINFGCPVKKVLGRCPGRVSPKPARNSARNYSPCSRRGTERNPRDSKNATRNGRH